MDHDTWQWQEPDTVWKGAGLYHVTMVVPSRQPLFGELIIPNDDPLQAFVKRTDLGNAVVDRLLRIPEFYLEVQVLHFCLMPNHLHAILYVRRAMKKGISSVITGFWRAARTLGRAYSFALSSLADSSAYYTDPALLRTQIGNDAFYAISPVFKDKPFLRPMSQYRQLPTAIRYLDMNPARLATKRLKPGFFCVQHNVEINGRMYDAVGNIFLLSEEHRQPVHVRHDLVNLAKTGNDQPIRDYMNDCVKAARQGTVMVSPYISSYEKDVLSVLLKENRFVILLADNGFGKFFKPSDALFDAVAQGRLLILSPWQHDPDKRHIARPECVALNGMAEEISASK